MNKRKLPLQIYGDERQHRVCFVYTVSARVMHVDNTIDYQFNTCMSSSHALRAIKQEVGPPINECSLYNLSHK